MLDVSDRTAGGEGVESGDGVSPSPAGVRSAWEGKTTLQKIYEFCPQERRILVYYS